MKALRKLSKGYDCMDIVEIEEPVAKNDLVKIKVAYAGICGTDLHTFQGKYSANKPPVTLGHEFSGVVVEVGPEVKNIKVGDRVSSETTFETCGECVYCKNREYNLCSSRKGIGTQVDGSFAEYVVSREESVHVLPDNVSLLDAALCEPAACGVHGALEVTTINEGDKVLIFGPGAIGLLLSQIVKSQGGYVILAGINKDKERFELAKKIGVDRIINQQEENIDEVIKELTNGLGVDKVFECSGAIPALNKGLELARKKADIVQLGVFVKDFNEINTGLFFPKELRYLGSRTQNPYSWEKLMKLLADEKIHPKEIVTMVTDLENWREGFQKSIDCEEVKVVLKCNDIEE